VMNSHGMLSSSAQRSSVNPRKPERSEGSVGVQRPVGQRRLPTARLAGLPRLAGCLPRR
jgi:hypothetical protein